MQIGKSKNHYFEKHLLRMVLNLTVYVNSAISLFYKQIRIIKSFLAKKPILPIFHLKWVIWVKSAMMTSLWRHTWVFVLLLECSERGAPL